jgi:hypothetical protein
MPRKSTYIQNISTETRDSETRLPTYNESEATISHVWQGYAAQTRWYGQTAQRLGMRLGSHTQLQHGALLDFTQTRSRVFNQIPFASVGWNESQVPDPGRQPWGSDSAGEWPFRPVVIDMVNGTCGHVMLPQVNRN